MVLTLAKAQSRRNLARSRLGKRCIVIGQDEPIFIPEAFFPRGTHEKETRMNEKNPPNPRVKSLLILVGILFCLGKSMRTRRE
jgi:hypothetical protein